MAVVEMAMVGSLLGLLLFGILIFGYLMSFRQNMVQAAAEGARAGATAVQGNAAADGRAAAEQSISGFHACNGGLTCDVTQGACPNAPTVQCITVRLTYDYAHFPLLPEVPLVSAFMPSTITASSIAEVYYP
jgi:Flp pilus assembly protein TadG